MFQNKTAKNQPIDINKLDATERLAGFDKVNHQPRPNHDANQKQWKMQNNIMENTK